MKAYFFILWFERILLVVRVSLHCNQGDQMILWKSRPKCT
jgi:hypothetical protein